MSDSVHLQCRTIIGQQIAALQEVQGFCRTDEVLLRRWPWDLEQIFPGITIWDQGFTYADDAPCGSDDIVYRCPVTLVCSNERESRTHLDRLPVVEAAIRRWFHDKRRITGLVLPSGARPGVTKVVPDMRYDPPKKAAWDPANYEIKHLLVLAHVREVRPT